MMNWWQSLLASEGSVTWLAGLSGALIGGLFAILAAVFTTQATASLMKAQRRTVVVGGIKAIWAEMIVNFVSYEERVGYIVRGLKPDEYLTIQWSMQFEYFGVYATNAGFLGELGDDGLAGEIISVVSSAKGLVESVTLNSEKFREFSLLSEKSRRGEGGTELALAAVDLEVQLVEYAQIIKREDERISAAILRISPRIAALK